jgi:hypothetical protein
MKPATFKTGRLLLSLLIVGLTVGLVSWDHQKSPGRYGQTINDTTPKAKTGDKKIRDLDEAMEEINKGEWKEDMEKAMKELKEAMKSVDGEKIKVEIEKALRDVDLTKVQQELKEEMGKIDFSKIKEEIAKSMKEVDMTKLQEELKEKMGKVDWDKMKLEMEKLKEVDMSKLKIDMDKLSDEMKELGPKIEKEMQKAKGEIEKAKGEIQEYKDFVDGLEKDGLLKKDNYSLKYKDGELLINGKKAPADTYNKYKSFLEKHKKFLIEKNDDNFNISLD